MKLVTLFLLSLFTTHVFASEQGAITSKPQKTESAIFAGGCFWCMEPPFDKLDGVISTTSGYTAGHKKNPTYKEVSAGSTGHTEAIEIIYDPGKITYSELLDVFWKNIDPVAVDRQFCDAGSQYRSGIYYLDEKQQAEIERSLQELNSNKPFKDEIATEILPASTFYPAEDYHQDYYQKNPLRYQYYRFACGRDQRLQEIWGSDNQ
ncbi:MAG: peptide-methionine (S)-S-oxide reductase MsrA [Gammaproteobacteria bacterium]|nr:peptide-methionine (S)-S-oxide reductase MsrA [Gammaproteobacteria bacterium]MBT8134700.1 peptide-methionine (S)-S-oxide reductase MsrA [Gammaproteobacteria bacterium]NNJ50285.1 peptide-methionine (S)-S-oxide reductase MsrA [Gammaproteobacteria bacterium]